MNYIVWHKTEFNETWSRFDCVDEAATGATVLELAKKEGDVEVTVPIDYKVKVSIGKPSAEIIPKETAKEAAPEKPVKEEPKVEVSESGPQEDQGTGGTSNKPVRRGD